MATARMTSNAANGSALVAVVATRCHGGYSVDENDDSTSPFGQGDGGGGDHRKSGGAAAAHHATVGGGSPGRPVISRTLRWKVT